MARIPAKQNYAKLVLQAEKSKSKVKQSQIDAYAKWQKKLGKKSKKLDALDDNFRKILKVIKAFEQKQQEDEDTARKLLRLVEGAHKELETYKQVPVPGKFPEMPKNITALSSISLAVGLMITYLALVKIYMATSEALTKKDASK